VLLARVDWADRLGRRHDRGTGKPWRPSSRQPQSLARVPV